MKMLTTTAFAALMTLGAGTAMAQESALETMQPASMETASTDAPELIRTRDITGGAIYSMSGDPAPMWDQMIWEQGVAEDWTQIGEIEDIVLTADGRVEGIIAEIGGFLDIGDKHVMLPLGDVRFVPVDDQSYAFVTRLSEDQLMLLDNVDEGFWN